MPKCGIVFVLMHRTSHRLVIIILSCVVCLVLLLVLVTTVFSARWTKNRNGIWVAHGSPKTEPAEARQQLFLLQEARLAFRVVENSGADMSAGPCLGPIFAGWVADVVHVPRQSIDDDAKNSCPAPADGGEQHTLEVDKHGELVKIQ